ncbi:hypothetical protein L1887_51392 [Cichorium endivia]|nr:hypothetical protein L1887_51392 [Cichorium endivia]
MSDSLVRVSRRAEWGAHRPVPGARRYIAETARAANHDRRDGISTSLSTARALAAAPIRTGPRPESIGRTGYRRSTSDRDASPAPIRFPPDNFKPLFDSLFKVLFIFPSRYLFAIGLTPVFSPWTEFTALLGLHSQTTRLADSASWCDRVRATTGLSPSLAPPFQGTWARSAAEDASPDYNSDSEAVRFSSWADPASSQDDTLGSSSRASLTAHDARHNTRVFSTTTSRASTEGDSSLGQPHHKHGRPISAPDAMCPDKGCMVGGDAMRDAQAGVPSAGWLWAQLAFKNSMVHVHGSFCFAGFDNDPSRRFTYGNLVTTSPSSK